MANIDLEIDQGATFRASIYYKNPDGTPVPLTGYSAFLQARAGNDNTSELFFELTSTIPYTSYGDITITPLDGGIHLHIPDEVTKEMLWTIGNYDLFIIEPGAPSAGAEKVSKGKIVVNKSVSIIS